MKPVAQKNDHGTVAVVGAGSWGTALAYHLGVKGVPVDLWVYEDDVAEQIRTDRENRTYLSGVKLPETVRPSGDLQNTVRGKEVVLMVVPSHVMRGILEQIVGVLSPGVILVNASKGIENDTLMTMTQVMEDVAPNDMAFHRAVISGPTFAREVGRSLPTAMTVACADRQSCGFLQRLFASHAMRVYASQDLIGVQLGGALKNIYAIGAGISDGLGLGTNARAGLITRSLAEMSRLGVKMGANPLTFMGLAGLGDLVLTCTGDLSRNRTVGMKLGQGRKLQEILQEMKMVAEGVKTTRAVHDLARREHVEMPVAEQIYMLLYEDKDPKKGLFDLMTRSLKDEIDQGLMIF